MAVAFRSRLRGSKSTEVSATHARTHINPRLAIFTRQASCSSSVSAGRQCDAPIPHATRAAAIGHGEKIYKLPHTTILGCGESKAITRLLYERIAKRLA
jgi:hypothetical protein